MKTMQTELSGKSPVMQFLASWSSTIFGLIVAGVLLSVLV